MWPISQAEIYVFTIKNENQPLKCALNFRFCHIFFSVPCKIQNEVGMMPVILIKTPIDPVFWISGEIKKQDRVVDPDPAFASVFGWRCLDGHRQE
jgi:hypothetical protein